MTAKRVKGWCLLKGLLFRPEKLESDDSLNYKESPTLVKFLLESFGSVLNSDFLLSGTLNLVNVNLGGGLELLSFSSFVLSAATSFLRSSMAAEKASTSSYLSAAQEAPVATAFTLALAVVCKMVASFESS